MKKIILTIIVCVSITTSALADPIDYTNGVVSNGGIGKSVRYYGYYTGNGGEFTVYGSGLTLDNSLYASTTSGIGGHEESFQTFCLERDESTHDSGVNVFVSQSFVNGSEGSHAYKGGINTDGGDDLDERTAYLYYQFATGNLSNYSYTSGRATSAGQLQAAIWYLEDEYASWIPESGSQVDLWIQEAEGAIQSGEWVGIGNVRVLQTVWVDDEGNEYRQDFLYVTPVPGAVLLGMLGMAVAGVKLRKFA
jgi:hypothetical protein